MDTPDEIENVPFIERQFKRVSRNLLIANGIVIGLIVLIGWISSTYYVGFFRGPLPVSEDDILAAARRSGSGLIAYVEMADRELIPTGYLEESSKNGKVYSVIPYFFTPIGDKLLLVKTYSAADGKRLVGPLQYTSVKTDKDAYDAIVAQHPELNGQILPIMLNGAAAYNVAGYIGLALFLPLLLLCTYNVGKAFCGLTAPLLHPVARALSRFGEPHDIAESIDNEISQGDCPTFGKALLTRSWLLRPTVFGMIICRPADIVWVYVSVINGDHIATLWLRNGKGMGVPLKKEATERLLAEIVARAPWVERGYDAEKMRRWKRQRTEFLAAVDQRRNRMVGQ
jgi:hypothetical protein